MADTLSDADRLRQIADLIEGTDAKLGTIHVHINHEDHDVQRTVLARFRDVFGKPDRPSEGQHSVSVVWPRVVAFAGKDLFGIVTPAVAPPKTLDDVIGAAS